MVLRSALNWRSLRSLNGFSGILIAISSVGNSAFGFDALPYGARTRSYFGWSTGVHGDIRTVGMSGSTVGLGDTFIASTTNPAGLAMTLAGGDLNFSGNWIRDQDIQGRIENRYRVTSGGGALSLYPWGISLGYLTPWHEGGTYTLASLGGRAAALSAETNEIRLGVARVFFDNRLSLGVNLTLGSARTELAPQEDPGIPASVGKADAVGATFGAMLQLPERIILGASYTLPMNYQIAGDGATETILPGFHQPIHVPGLFVAGVGWIPNRYFRSDFSLSFIGKSEACSLVRDDRIELGRKTAIQPRAGLAYVIADFREFRATVYTGSYLEPGVKYRGHWTGGIELRPWILSLGWGVDLAQGYRNSLVSGSINVLKVAQKMELIPPNPPAEHRGFLPRFAQLSDRGLARPLARDWRPEVSGLNPVEVGRELPSKLQEKFQSPIRSLQRLGDNLGESLEKTFTDPIDHLQTEE